MKFGRFTSYVWEHCIIFGVIFLAGLAVFIPYAIKRNDYIVVPAFILGYLLYMAFLYITLGWTAKVYGGRLSDYIVFTDERVELHCKESVSFINWSEVVEIRQIAPARGMRKVEIVARDGTRILFASDGRREKQIWKMHPELKAKLTASRM